jgi:PAS domain S-box-containing protein
VTSIGDKAAWRDLGLPEGLIESAKADLPFSALLDAQSRIIDHMASGHDLRETLSEITRLVETLAPPALCTILLLDMDGRHLRVGAAPSLPEPYNRAMDGLEIGPSVGSCGTAAYRRRPVIVSDIATDPLFEGPRDFILSFGLRACWSMPVLNEHGSVLGTVAMYYRETREPTGRDWGLLEPAARLIRLALAQQRKKDELGEAEARWRIAADATRLGTFDIDLATGDSHWSDQFKAILGLAPGAPLGRERLVAAMRGEERERFAAAFDGWLRSESGVAYAEHHRVLRFDDRAERWIVVTGRLLLNPDGKPYRAIGTCSDITEQKRHEADLAAAKTEAERASRTKSEFLANMSHEIRTPLNAILGFSEIIKDALMGSVAERYRSYAADIHSSGQYLLKVINDVLDLSKIEAERLELHEEPVEIAEIVEACRRLVGERAQAGRIAVTVDLSPGMPPVLADAMRLKQIVLNLLANAIKFTPAGGQVKVSTSLRADGVGIRVEDTGIGMDADEIPRALEPFQQIESTLSRRYEGTGLGLPLAKRLVELHGGILEIASEPGVGTTVTILLPRQRVIIAAEVVPAS